MTILWPKVSDETKNRFEAAFKHLNGLLREEQSLNTPSLYSSIGLHDLWATNWTGNSRPISAIPKGTWLTLYGNSARTIGQMNGSTVQHLSRRCTKCGKIGTREMRNDDVFTGLVQMMSLRYINACKLGVSHADLTHE